MDDYPRPRFEGWSQVLQDFDAVFVRPVMKDRSKVIDVGCLGLRCEEVAILVSIHGKGYRVMFQPLTEP
jgi:hypothetical protein